MTDAWRIDVDAIDREGPYDPEKLLDYVLERMEKEVSEARRRSVAEAATAEIESFYRAAEMVLEANALKNLFDDEYARDVILLLDPDAEFDLEDLTKRLEDNRTKRDRLVATTTGLIDYHLRRHGLYVELGVKLKMLMGALPLVRRQVRHTKLLSSLSRSLALLAVLALLIMLEVSFGHFLHELFRNLIPEFAQWIVAFIVVVVSLGVVERLMDRALELLHWRLFERVRGAQAATISDIKAAETALVELLTCAAGTPPAAR